MINPELGHAVEYYPEANSTIPGPAPLTALITHVYSDREIAVRVFGRTGGAWTKTSVRLLQDREMARIGQGFAKYPDTVRKEAGEVGQQQETNPDLSKQRLTEFLQGPLLSEIANRKLDIGATEFRNDNQLLLVNVEASGYKVQIVVPFEMVAGDAKPATVASNLCHGAVKEIEAMKAEDGVKLGKKTAAPAVPPAPKTTAEGFGGDGD